MAVADGLPFPEHCVAPVHSRSIRIRRFACEVVMQAVNHFLYTMTGLTLERFLPQDALDISLGFDLKNAKLPPVSERYLLRAVPYP